MTVFAFIASMEFYRTTLFSNAIPDELPRGTEFLSYLFASFVILYYFCKYVTSCIHTRGTLKK